MAARPVCACFPGIVSALYHTENVLVWKINDMVSLLTLTRSHCVTSFCPDDGRGYVWYPGHFSLTSGHVSGRCQETMP